MTVLESEATPSVAVQADGYGCNLDALPGAVAEGTARPEANTTAATLALRRQLSFVSSVAKMLRGFNMLL